MKAPLIHPPAASYPDLQGDVAIITGAAAGIGLAIASALLVQGTRVVLVDLDEPGLNETLRLLNRPVDTCAVAGSVANPEVIEKAYAEAMARWGRLDLLVNNAGIFANFPSLELTLQDWQRTIDVNLTGVFVCTQAIAKRMVEKGQGGIINLSSIYGTVAAPKRAAYAATKAAVTMLTKVWAVEWAHAGVRVNAIAPGYVLTEATLALQKQGKIDVEAIKRRTPQGRLGTPEEMARAVLFFASRESAHITGQILGVDGGWTAYGYL